MRKSVDWRELLAFGAIYLLWGGTFLAVRIAVLDMPPLFTAGIRFCAAGSVLYAVMRYRGERAPSPLEWRNLGLIGLLMFVLTYGPLFWAMQYVTSSMTAVIEATLPITMVALEVWVFRTQRLQMRTACGVVVGFVGVSVLLFHNGAQQLSMIPIVVILAGGIAWCFGTVLSGRLTLPASKPLNAGAQMMLGGMILLGLSAVTGELRALPPITMRAAAALVYLILFGSLVAYTAYVWLLGRFSATRVSSHAYVNPLVAVALGYFVAGEVVTTRSLLACLIIAVSVFLILAEGRDLKGGLVRWRSRIGHHGAKSIRVIVGPSPARFVTLLSKSVGRRKSSEHCAERA